MHAFQPSTTSRSLALGALALFGTIVSADQQASNNAPSMQVYHECTEQVYCKYFALTGKSTDWELVPSRTVKSYNYPTEQYNATVWCGKAPNEDAYSYMQLSLEDTPSNTTAQSVSYFVGTYGTQGDKTPPPFVDAQTVFGPVNGSNQTRCNIIKCKAGDASCTSGAHSGTSPSCTPNTNIRWSFCMSSASTSVSSSQSNFTSSSVKLRPVRAATFIA